MYLVKEFGLSRFTKKLVESFIYRFVDHVWLLNRERERYTRLSKSKCSKPAKQVENGVQLQNFCNAVIFSKIKPQLHPLKSWKRCFKTSFSESVFLEKPVKGVIVCHLHNHMLWTKSFLVEWCHNKVLWPNWLSLLYVPVQPQCKRSPPHPLSVWRLNENHITLSYPLTRSFGSKTLTTV